ncbi:MAG: hypothetical protein ABR587_02115 [Candidatus Binatia bacterium]
MPGVKSVRQLDDTNLLWNIDIGEEKREWTAKITEQATGEFRGTIASAS